MGGYLMSVNQEELTAALSDALGGQPSTEEGLDYARMIMQQNMRSPGIDPSVLDPTRQQQEGVVGVLQQARERLMAQRGPSRAEKLFALSAGLGAPTKTGSIGETAGNVASQMLPIAQEQRQFEMDRGDALSKLDMAEVQSMGPVNQAEIGLAELEYKQRQQNMREALKTISRGGGSRRGSAGSRTREAKIADLINEWGYSRKDAAALVDRFVSIEIVPETGRARLINEIEKTVSEVPLESLSEYIDDDGRVLSGYEPSGSGTVEVGEVDRRTEEEKDVDLFVTQAFRKGASLFDMAPVGSGPVPEILAGLSIPSSVFGGPIASETLIARQGLRLRARDLARTLIDNPRMPVRLIEMALEEAAIEPGFLDTGPIMQARMIALDSYLYQKYLDTRRYADDKNAPEDLREIGATNSLAIGTFLRSLGVPEHLRRRSPMVPMTEYEETSGTPDLSRVPYGVEMGTWDNMSPDEKRRYLELTESLKEGE